MNLKSKLRARNRLDEADLLALVETAEAALRGRGIPLPRATGDLFERADALAAALPEDVATPSTPTASAGSGARADLVAEYQRVQSDPIARAEFFARHGDAVVKAIDADRRAIESARRGRTAEAPASGAALLAEYERVKGDPTARAQFLAKHDRELAALCN